MKIPILYQCKQIIKKIMNKISDRNKQFDNELITHDYKLFKKSVKYSKKYSKNFDNFWKDQEEWQLKNINSNRYEKQVEYIREKFIPKLNKEDVVCDYACACGDFSFLVGDYVKKVDGYDISEKMIEKANQTAQNMNINNIEFMQANASSFKLNRKYSAFMMLGLLTCIYDNKKTDEIIKMVAKTLPPKGLLIVKDNLTTDAFNYYINEPRFNKISVYRTVDNYKKLFEKNGFKFVDEIFLEKLVVNNYNWVSFIGVLEKK